MICSKDLMHSELVDFGQIGQNRRTDRGLSLHFHLQYLPNQLAILGHLDKMLEWVLNSQDHSLGLDLVQILVTEATCTPILIRALALEVHQFPVWAQMIGVGLLLTMADVVEGVMVLYAIVISHSIFLVTKTVDRGPQNLKALSPMKIVHLLIVTNTAHLLQRPVMSLTTARILSEYKDAKFFIIKSYSEDNVRKSIKYGIWASTPNGNRKLDAAYREAKEKNTCPVFLFFSVNASAQFCGVAEMVGPVDFDNSVDYWQQDKWSGQFPVKWHIIRDVPNSQFRHIVLENNDNKPVTNSRDTQEAKLEQGIEMLKIFNNYESNMSILDDFEFYEDRQKAMQERKARQQQQQPSLVVGIGESAGNVVTTTLSSNFIQQISKSFAQVVHLEDYAKEGSDSVSVTERTTGTASDASMTNGHKLENATTVVSSTSKTS
ncbi:hypothetical protein ACSBR1_023826 [Camellia fascicularis]